MHEKEFSFVGAYSNLISSYGAHCHEKKTQKSKSRVKWRITCLIFVCVVSETEQRKKEPRADDVKAELAK